MEGASFTNPTICNCCGSFPFKGGFPWHKHTPCRDKWSAFGRWVSISKDAKTTAILKAEELEIVRVVLLAGHEMREHKAPGEITVQCIEGRIEFRTPETSQTLGPGDLIHLRSKEPHALRALTDASALVTMRVGRTN
jgi:quercetin dioxygenase-like cupin family protein